MTRISDEDLARAQAALGDPRIGVTVGPDGASATSPVSDLIERVTKATDDGPPWCELVASLDRQAAYAEAMLEKASGRRRRMLAAEVTRLYHALRSLTTET